MSRIRQIVWGCVALLTIFVLWITHESPRKEYRHGHVIDQAGRPISGVYVLMSLSWSQIDSTNSGFLSSGVTDANGAFEVSREWRAGFATDSPPPWYYVNLEFCHPDFIPVERSDGKDKVPDNLIWKGHVHENASDIRLTLAKRPQASAYPWGGSYDVE